MSKEMNALIDAAEERAKLYDDDDRDCIKVDVMNAFFSGAEYAQAAANKAAEEGGLPYGDALDTIAANAAREVGGIFTDAIPIKSLVVYARAVAKQAIAADRASRQVANKAEQPSAIFDKNAEIAKFEEWIENDREITGENGIDPAIKKACETTWIAAKVETWLFGAVANKAEVEPFAYVKFRAAQRITTEGDVDANEWYEFCEQGELGDDKLPAFPVYATPPATTGASTAPVDGDCLYAAWHKIGADVAGLEFSDFISALGRVGASDARDQALEQSALLVENNDLNSAAFNAEEIRALKGSVGASTVLTDERIDVYQKVMDICSEQGQFYVDAERNELASVVYALMSRFEYSLKVAAQAGQVAVPLTNAQLAAGREAIFSTDNPYCPCDSKTFRKVAEWVERHHGIATPSPAKESE